MTFGSGGSVPAGASSVAPGMTQTVTVPANSLVLISAGGTITCDSASDNGYSVVNVDVLVDAQLVPGLGSGVDPANTPGLHFRFQPWSIAGTVPLSAGQHTISVRATVNSGGAGIFLSRGNLTVTILNT